MGFAWAAYKRGSFDNQENVAPNLEALEFGSALTQWATDFMNQGGEVVVPLATIGDREIPVGIISIAYEKHRAYPHAVFFPEASDRIRLEIGVKFLVELKKNYLVIIDTPDRTLGYFRHLARYGLLQAVGKMRDYYGKGQDAMWFQSRGE